MQYQKCLNLSIEDLARSSSLTSDAAVAAMVDSYKYTGGPLHPILVSNAPGPDGRLEVLAGKVRLEAARRSGLESVAAVKITDERLAKLAPLVENLVRSEHDALDEARAIVRLIEQLVPNVLSEQIDQKPGRPRGGNSELARRLSVLGGTEQARRQRISRSLAINVISPAAEQALRAAQLQNNRRVLQAVARCTKWSDQLAKVAEIVAERQSRSRKRRRSPTESPQDQRAIEPCKTAEVSRDQEEPVTGCAMKAPMTIMSAHPGASVNPNVETTEQPAGGKPDVEFRGARVSANFVASSSVGSSRAPAVEGVTSRSPSRSEPGTPAHPALECLRNEWMAVPSLRREWARAPAVVQELFIEELRAQAARAAMPRDKRFPIYTAA
jgi:ParB-like chromosome segregation protein Spo0J